MPRQLNIRSDEAYEAAHRLADHLGQTTTRIVEDALRAYAAGRIMPSRKVTRDDAEAFVAELGALIETANRNRPAGLTSDHSDFYDENGLPV